MAGQPVRLTTLAHGGGCGCKIAPAVLSKMLQGLPPAGCFPDLLVGAETADDAAVWRLNAEQAVVATTDFFMPVVDDPYDFGRIAATNAISDIYAMGGKPILALAVVGMPVDKLPVETIRVILDGGASVCAAAGIPVAGGHSIDSPEPIYGLVVLGLVHPDQVKTNRTVQVGDVLILTKPLGVGILSAALKKGLLTPEGYAELLATATRLNAVGAVVADWAEVHAMTDVTGFGLLGHLLELCRGSGVSSRIDVSAVPVMPIARDLAGQGITTGAAGRNWASYGHAVRLPTELPAWQRTLLCDPQTSGGLLIACAAEASEKLLSLLHDDGFDRAARIGGLAAGAPVVVVEG